MESYRITKTCKSKHVTFFTFFRSFFGFGTWKENCFIKKEYFYKNKFLQVVEGRDKEQSDIFSNFTLFRKLMHIKFRANLLKTVDLYKKRTNKQFVNI